MPKIERKNNNSDSKTPSYQMLKNIKNKMPIDLFEVMALKTSKENSEIVVCKFDKSEMEEYINKYVKEFIDSIDDEFIFSYYSSPISAELNYFIPKLFWDKVLLLASKIDA